jgi:hypothetical protein
MNGVEEPLEICEVGEECARRRKNPANPAV